MLSRFLWLAEWRSHPARTAMAVLTIALGVALGFAVQLINSAAYGEFSAAARSLSGQADLQVRGIQRTIDERWYPRIARLKDVDVASPVLELNASVPGRDAPLKIIGSDVFQASRLTPDLLGVPDPKHALDTVGDETIFLSTAAQRWLGVKTGDRLRLLAGSQTVSFRVAGALLRSRPGQRLAVMDIATVQWRFGLLGRLTRIDIKLRPGSTIATFRRDLAALGAASDAPAAHSEIVNQNERIEHHPGVDRYRDGLTTDAASLATLLIKQPSDEDSRTDRLSRAYRVNMNVLALVALFTGAFLVLSTQAASVIQRRSQFALLRVIGWTRTQLLRHVLLEGLMLGVAGAVAGLLIGYSLAYAALRLFGSDLGGGYFPGVRPTVQVEWLPSLLFLLLGIGVALLGSVAPAIEAARAQPAGTLKAGSEEPALHRLSPPWPGMLCVLLAGVLTRVPPVFDIPIAGYVAVALLLIGGIALMPRITGSIFTAASQWRSPRRLVPTLALARLANAPGQASIAMGGVLCSFALIVAMAVMVASFRVSVEDWLTHLLSADLYVSASTNGDTAGLGPQEQATLLALPGVRHLSFTRISALTLDPRQPDVALLARSIDIDDPGQQMQLTGPVLPRSAWHSGDIPIWVSEAMVDVYGYRLGQRLSLPIAAITGKLDVSSSHFVVAGIWRDYVRQTGAIQMRLQDYRRLTHDDAITEIAVTPAPGTAVDTLIDAMRALPFGGMLHFSQPGEIRARTLTIFDRSFAVTYLLEGVAIVIGLFGVAATFSAQALARTREFGMLRHVGVSRGQILTLLAAEGGCLTLLGIGLGCIVGFAISLILVFVVNPQSFHWSMSLHIPWRMIAAVAATMLLSSTLTALVAGRNAVGVDAVRAVREDW